MLGFIFRSVFFIGVLGWYSTSMWRMIDDYFRDQFQKYLQEEYSKNPKMREDVQRYRQTDKSSNDVVGRSPPPSLPTEEEIKQSLAPDTCIDSVEIYTESMPDGTTPLESGVEKAAIDNNATVEVAGSGKPEESEERSNVSVNTDTVTKQISVPHTIVTKRVNVQRKQSESIRKKWQPRNSIIESTSEPKKKHGKVKTITLTTVDFESVRTKSKDYDFSEFDVDEEGEEKDTEEFEEGILVSELPFKPKADIGRLQRVTENEFCPLSLDDEATCGQTMKWP